MATSKSPGAQAKRTTTKPAPALKVGAATVTPSKPSAAKPSAAKPAAAKPAARAIRPAAQKSAATGASVVVQVSGASIPAGTKPPEPAKVGMADQSGQTAAGGVGKSPALAGAPKAEKAVVGKKVAEKRTSAVRPAKPPAGKAAPQPAEKGKEKREKVVRDSFSMPKTEHAGLKTLRTDLAKAGRICTKSELLRAGLRLVSGRSIESLVKLLDTLPAVPKGKSAKR